MVYLFFVIPTEVERISLFVVPYFIYRDFSTALEMTVRIRAPEKILHSKRFLGKRSNRYAVLPFITVNGLLALRIATLSFRPSVSAWRNLVIRSFVLCITGFLDYARNDSNNRCIPKRFLLAKRF